MRDSSEDRGAGRRVVQLREDVARCTICAPFLPLAPRPLAQFGQRSRILIIGQAPGIKAHESGIPWSDDSGDRLRAWTGIDAATFYDAQQIALMPMGFCYPGKGKSGDLPPRRECAPQWHARLLAEMPAVTLTLVVGMYAQSHYLAALGRTLTERVRNSVAVDGDRVALPHPSWRSLIWQRRNPWFEAEMLPLLRERVADALA